MNTNSILARLPETGFLKRRQIVPSRGAPKDEYALLPIRESSWWQGIKDGRFPKPVYPFGPGEPLWRIEDIRALIEELGRRDVVGEPIKRRRVDPNANHAASGGDTQQKQKDDD